MNQMLIAGRPEHQIHLSGRVWAGLDGIRVRWVRWAAKRRERAALLSLSDAELKDLGVSRAQVGFEYSRWN